MIVLAPGYTSPRIPLNDAMATARADRIAKHEHEKAKRKARGAPQSDDVDYAALAECLEQAAQAASAGDDDSAISLIQDAGGFLASSVRAPEPFEPRPEWSAIEIECVLVSRETWVDGRYDAVKSAAAGDTAPLYRLLESCFRVHGIEVEGGELEGAALWSHADIAGALLQVADYFQTVDFEAKKRFGSQMR